MKKIICRINTIILEFEVMILHLIGDNVPSHCIRRFFYRLGGMKIGKGCKIENSLLRGPTIVGNHVVIKDSFIGPYSSIGDGCEIVGAKIENSILVKNVRVNCPKQPIDSSLIGDGTAIEGNNRFSNSIELFVGNQCTVKL